MPKVRDTDILCVGDFVETPGGYYAQVISVDGSKCSVTMDFATSNEPAPENPEIMVYDVAELRLVFTVEFVALQKELIEERNKNATSVG